MRYVKRYSTSPIVYAADEVKLFLRESAGVKPVDIYQAHCASGGAILRTALRVAGATAAAGAAFQIGRAAGVLEGVIAAVPMLLGPDVLADMPASTIAACSYMQAGIFSVLAGGLVLGQRGTACFKGLCVANVAVTTGILGWSAGGVLVSTLLGLAAGGATALLKQDGGSVFFSVHGATALPLGMAGGIAGALCGLRVMRDIFSAREELCSVDSLEEASEPLTLLV